MLYRFTTLLGILLFAAMTSLSEDTPPEMNGNDTSPNYYVEKNTPVVIFPEFTISDQENGNIKGLTISFSSGHHYDQDNLSFSNQNGITGSFNKSKGILTLTGDASPENYQTAVRSITYTNDAPESVNYEPRTMTISLVNPDYFSQDGTFEEGHFYEYINSPHYFIDAYEAASAKTYYGLQGYLATITSPEENTFIADKVPDAVSAVWLGGTDEQQEGSWLWTGGPESGSAFYEKATDTSHGYTNWYDQEPNNSGGGNDENCLLMYINTSPRPKGTWGDGGNATDLAYVVEYGGMTDDPNFNMTTTTTLNIIRPKAPGGIVENLELWLNAEKGFTYTSSTDAEWIDQSQNKLALNVNLIQSPDAGTVAPTLEENSGNFNPTLVFDGANTGLASAVDAADFDFSEMSVFSVQQVASGVHPHTVWHYDNNGYNDLAFFIDGNATGNQFNITVNNSTLGNLSTPVLTDDIPHLVGFTSNNLSAQIYVDATNVLDVAGQSPLAANGALMIGLDADNSEAEDGDNHLKGNISEVIMFRKKLSALDQQKVGSYLALKYGISLTSNYIASDGTTSIWTDDSDGYNHDIFGIGRDDASGLNQKVSKSASDGTILTVSIDANFTSANNDERRTTEHTNDLQFLTLANNGSTLIPQFTEVDAASGFNVRIGREWKVDASNFTQNVNLKFEGANDGWTLYKDNDGDFTSGATALGTLEDNGEITDISLADGDYLTLGKQIDAPGGVFANLRVWFNANSGTTNGGSTITNGNITSWMGQPVQSTTITNVNNVAGDPAVVSNSANFNAVVSFDGDDAIRTSSTAPYTTYFNSSTDNNTVFLVKKSVAGNVEAGYGSDDNRRNDRAGYFERNGDYQRTDYGSNITVMTGTTTTINKYVIARQDVQPNNLSLFLDGALEKQNGTFSSLSGSADGYLGFGANPFDFSFLSTVDIAEYIIYASDLSATEIKEVESYLALKYGISLTENYIASNGSTSMWTDDSDGYNKDIFGIGRDDASGLNQKVSKSANDGSILSVALDAEFTSANNDDSRTTNHTNDLQFLTVANNGAALTPQYTELDAASDFNVRIGREWKVDATNFTQNISMKFEGYDETWSLIATADGDFSSEVTVIGTLNDNGELTTSTPPIDGLTFTLAKAQPAPGGVATGLQFWVKAGEGAYKDASNTLPANDDAVLRWSDLSVNSNDATNATSSQQPHFNSNGINFNPALTFNNNDDYLQLSSMTGFPTGANPYTVYTVASNSTTGDYQWVFSYGYNSDKQVVALGRNNNNSTNIAIGHYNSDVVSGGSEFAGGTPVVFGATYNGTSSVLRKPGISASTTTVSLNVGSNYAYIGRWLDVETSYWNGNIGEIFVYNENLTGADLQKVESYMALKYGYSMGQTTPTDYLASDGTILWDAIANATYKTHIFGIGQDNSSGLNQKVARSVNDGNGPILATTQNFTASNSDESRTGLGDGNFMMMGHNDATENSFTSSFNGGTNNRSDRVWKVDETGTVGDVYFAIPYSAATFPSGGSPALVISGDETFDNTDEVVLLTYDRTNGLYWAQIDPADGDYISLATSEISVTYPAYFRTRSDNNTDGITKYSSYNDFIADENGAFTLFDTHWNFGDSFFSDGIYFYKTNDVINQIIRYPSIEDLGADTNGVTYNLSQTWNYTDEFFASGDQFFRTASGDGTYGVTSYPSLADLVDNTNGTYTAFATTFRYEDQFFHDGQYFLRTNTGGDQAVSVTRYATLSDLANDVVFDNQTFGPYSTNDDIFAVGITASFTVSETALTIDEDAGTETFTVVLGAQPSNNVILNVTSDETEEATVDKATLTFTTANWNTPQTVTVTGVNDQIESDDEATITISVNDDVSDDTFDALDNQTIAITLTDDDNAGFTVSESELTINENAGTGSFSVVLNAKPSSDVVFNISSNDIDEASVSSSSLTFTTADWDTEQTILVTGVDDEIDRDDITTIVVSVNKNLSDDNFDELTNQAVAITLTDDDVAPTISTSTISSLSSNSVVMGGDMSNKGTADITETGVVYSSTNTSPEIGGTDVIKDDNGSYTGTYSESVGSLEPNTTYYYQAYATNTAGTSYGGVQSFTTKQTQSITFASIEAKTYGDSDFDPEATASSELTITYSSSDVSVATIVNGKIHILKAGSCTIYADQEGNENYDAATQASQTLTINKKSITVTAEAEQTKVYGDTDPTFTYTLSEPLESDDSFSGTLSREPGEDVDSYAITVGTLSAGSNYALSFESSDFSITQKGQTITFSALTNKNYGDADFDLTGSASSGLLVSYISSNTDVATVSGNTVTIVGAGTTTITASQTGNNNYKAAEDVQQELTVNKSDQTITFTSLNNKTYGDANFDLTGNSNSGLAVSYISSNTDVATISGNTVTIVGAGTTTITASQTGNDNYKAAEDVQQVLTVNKSDQTITFTSLSNKTYGDANFDLTGKSNSGLAVSYISSNTDVATTSENTVTIVGAGTTTITASQTGNDNYNAAVDVQQVLIVNKSDQTITFTSLNSKTYGDANFDLTGKSNSGLAVSYISSNTDVATTSGNTVTIVGAGTTTITASQTGNDDYNAAVYVQQELKVNKKALKVTAENKSKEYDGTTFDSFTVTYDGFVLDENESDLEGTLSFSGTATSATKAGEGYVITAGGLTSSNYNITFVDGRLDITLATQTIKFNPLPAKVYGDVPFNLTGTASSELAVTYACSNENVATISGNTVTIVGAGTTTITASQTGNDNYSPATDVQQVLTVSKADQLITLGNLPVGDLPLKDFTDPIQVTASSSSGLPVNISLGSESVATLNKSNQLESIGQTGNIKINIEQAGNENYKPASISYTFDVVKSNQAITFVEFSNLTYAPDLTVDLSNTATASSALEVTYTIVEGPATLDGTTLTVTGAGTIVIKASQEGDASYNPATDASQSLIIEKATPAITNFDNLSKIYEDLPFTLDATSESDGLFTYSSSNPDVATVEGNKVIIVGAGEVILTAEQYSDDNYTEASTAATLSVKRSDQLIVFDELSTKVMGNPDFVLHATGGNSGNPVTYSSSDETVALCNGINGQIVKIIGVGECHIYANQEGNSNYDAALQVSQLLTVYGYIAGDTDGDGKITPPEVAGDTNGDGKIGNGEVTGDIDGDGKITNPEVAGDTNGDGKIGNDEVAGDNDGDGKITDPELAGDTNGDGQIGNDEIAGDTDGDGKITNPEVAGDTNGDGKIGNDEVAGDTDGDGKIADPELAGDTNGDGQIGNDEIAGDTDGNGQITDPEVAGDTNGDGQIGNGEVAGDTDGDGKIIYPEVAGDTNGDGQIGNDEVAGDTDGDGKITKPEVAGDTNGDGQIGNDEVAGDTDGDGKITAPELAGDTNGDGQIGNGEVAGDTDGDGKITDTEVVGDINGDGQIGNGEIAGDTDGDGKITTPELAGDTNGDGQIGNGEVAGDTDGDGKITNPELAGDTNGDGQIGNGEVAGDTDGDGKITAPELAGDTNGDGQIGNGEVAGDNDGDGKITDPEVVGDTNGDGQISNGEVAGDTDGDGEIGEGETASGTIANIDLVTIDEMVLENPDDEIYYLMDCGDTRESLPVSFNLESDATTEHTQVFNMQVPAPGLYKEDILVESSDGTINRTYQIVVEKRFNYEDIIIQKYNNVLLVNNNPDTNGGYHFVSFNWYKNGQLIGTGQSYSAGDNASDQLDLNAQYAVEVETDNGDLLQTCDFSVSLTSSLSLTVTPNPVAAGSTIDVITTYSTDMIEDLKITVSSLFGTMVMQEKSRTNNNRLTLPSALTPGTYVVTTVAGGVELSSKIIIR